jgi:hypothetical protein
MVDLAGRRSQYLDIAAIVPWAVTIGHETDPPQPILIPAFQSGLWEPRSVSVGP